MPPGTGPSETAQAAIQRIRTKNGWRLVQHGTVLSEVLRSPGPTHSVFDVLAAAVHAHPDPRHVALLGFGGGGMIAALRALDLRCHVDGIDLDGRGWALFRRGAPDWAYPMTFRQSDAFAWLSRSRRRFDVIVDDLSIPVAGDVEKPSASWETLPRLAARRLAPGGLAVFNLLRPRTLGWQGGITAVTKHFGWATAVTFREFHNRIVIAGHGSPGPTHARLGQRIRESLRTLQSRQANGIHIRGVATRREEPLPPCDIVPSTPVRLG